MSSLLNVFAMLWLFRLAEIYLVDSVIHLLNKRDQEFYLKIYVAFVLLHVLSFVGTYKELEESMCPGSETVTSDYTAR